MNGGPIRNSSSGWPALKPTHPLVDDAGRGGLDTVVGTFLALTETRS